MSQKLQISICGLCVLFVILYSSTKHELELIHPRIFNSEIRYTQLTSPNCLKGRSIILITPSTHHINNPVHTRKFYLPALMNKIGQFLCVNCIYWKPGMLVFMWQIKFNFNFANKNCSCERGLKFCSTLYYIKHDQEFFEGPEKNSF